MTDAGRTAVTGRRLLRAIALAVAIAVIVGAVAYIALRPVALAAATKSQVVALLVYAALFAGLCSQFRPVGTPRSHFDLRASAMLFSPSASGSAHWARLFSRISV